MKKIQIFLCLLLCVFLVACSKKIEESSPSHIEAENNNVTTEEKLGTQWGDEINSRVTKVELTRKVDTPIAESIVHYADKNYKGKAVSSISLLAGKIEFSVLDDQGNKFPMYRAGENYYLAGKAGQSYQLQYKNSTDQTFEIVTSVDGIDVINGSEASRQNSGYVLNAHDSLSIEGFRKSENAVASFTFSKPDDAYAANSNNGSIQNTGVIGTVVYELNTPIKENKSVNEYAPPPNAFPADS